MVFVLVLLAIVTTLQAQQSPPRDARTSPNTGTAVIAGRVVDAETGAPIPRATLHIGLRTMGERPIEIEADGRGEFRVTGLPAGDYLVVVSPPELRGTHLPQMLNGDVAALMTGLLKPSLHLNDGEAREDVVIRLPQAFAIDGVVLDEFGDPMADVTVTAESAQPSVFGSSRPQQTDDRGMFRLFALAPGAYRVCASPTDDFDRRATGGEVAQRRYVKSCYPSAPAGGGERVTIGASTAVPSLSIVMQRAQGFTIAGRAVSESAKDVRVDLERLPESSGRSLPVEMQPGGSFIARGVPPGRYAISATAGGFSTNSSPAEYARTVVEVSNDISDLELVTTKGATLRGRVVPAEPLPPGTRLRIEQAAGLLSIEGGSRYSQSASVREDLSFEMTGVHGLVLFDVAGLPSGWVLSSVRYRGADVTDTSVPATTTAQPGELEIHVTSRSGRVIARPVDAEGRPMLAALAFLMPARGDRLSMQSILATAKPQNDRYELGPVRPGTYVVVGAAPADLFQVTRDFSRLEKLRQLGRVVQVGAGERVEVDVVVRPLPEVR